MARFSQGMKMTVDIDPDSQHLATFETSRSRLFSIAYRILGVRAEAEDVVQDTFVKWHLQRRAFGDNSVDTPAAWLATVAKRTAIDRLRRLKHELPHAMDVEEMIDAGHAPSAQSLAEQASDLSHGMRRVLERLSAEERAAFLLREAFEADYASIGEILNRTAAHCRQMVHRARTRVRSEDTGARAADRLAALRDASRARELAPLLDAIARQDVDALVALTLPPTVPATVAVAALAATANAQAHAASMITRALIKRLTMGRVVLETMA